MNETRANPQYVDAGPDDVYPGEVFDSSKYDAMRDLTEGSTIDLADAPILRSSSQTVDPRMVSNTGVEATKMATSNPPARISPMVTEERARTIRQANEEIHDNRLAAEWTKESS
jgi:hypothetical protein